MKVNNQSLPNIRHKPHGVRVDIRKLQEPRAPSVTKETGIKVDYEKLGFTPHRTNMVVRRFSIAACFVAAILSTSLFVHARTYSSDEPSDPVSFIAEAEPEKTPAVTETSAPVETITATPAVTQRPVSTETPSPKPTPKPTPVKTPKPTPKPTLKPVKTSKTPKPTPKPTSKPVKNKKSKLTKKKMAKTSKNGWECLGKGWRITRYCPKSCCNGSYAGSTSTGAKPTVGRTIAVDPSVIPYGTHVKIEGLDYEFVAEDCGGKVKGKHIDVLVNNCKSGKSLNVNSHTRVWIKK